jgi:hypothetical protein
MDPTKATEEKQAGNKAFSAKNFEEAIEHFTKSITNNDQDHTVFSNRLVSNSHFY